MDAGLVLVDAVNHQRTAPPDIIDTLVRQCLHTRRFDNDIKPIRVVVLQLLPLWPWVLPVQLDILITSIQLLSDVHLNTLVRGDDHARSAVELEQLGKNQAGWAGAEQQNFYADRRREFVETVNSTSGGLKEGRIFIGKVLNFVQLLLLTEGPISMSCTGIIRTY